MFITKHVPVAWRPLHPDVILPAVGTADAACVDVCAYLSEPLTLQPGDRALIPTGFAVAVPQGFSLRLYSRSGLAFKHGLMVVNGVGIIDADYRHEVKIIIANTGRDPFTIEPQMRICQADLVPVIIPQFHEVTVPDSVWFNTNRFGGFGSTGY